MSEGETTALLLPGQGSQFVGMGRDLAGAFPGVDRLYERADDLLGVALSRLCWEGPEEALVRTENAQPAILLHSYAVWTLLADRLSDRVVVAAGHSLGEFTAHLLAGTFGLEDALRLVRRRGELMARAGEQRPGAMAAVLGLDDDAVEAVCAEVEAGTVVPANFNSPGQVVISGDVAAVTRAGEMATERGARRVLSLSVSGAFHSPLMGEARDGLREALDAVAFSDPRFPVVANARAEAVVDAAGARATLVEQLTSPVRWAASVRTMAGLAPDRWLEIGPGSVLAGLLRRIDREWGATSVGDEAGVRAVLAESHDGTDDRE